MVRKLFALAGVSALTGLVTVAGAAGCTTTEASEAEDGGTRDGARRDTGPGARLGDEDDPVITWGPKCPSTFDRDADAIPYAKAGVSIGACTEQEQKDIKKFLDDAIAAQKLDFKQSEWAASVGVSCASCVFTEVDAASWGIIIQKDDEFFTYNRGACIEAVSGSEACGRGYQRLQACVLETCLNCSEQDASVACKEEQETSATGACGALVEQLQKDCGPDLGAYVEACKGSPLETGIRTVCITGPGPVDAGDGG